MSFRVLLVGLTALLPTFCLPNRTEAGAGPPAPQSTVLFQGVRIFDGKSATLFATFQCARARQQDRENLN
jgi:hypothetical protein